MSGVETAVLDSMPAAPAAPPAPQPSGKPNDEFDPVYIFRIRRHKAGNFHNLWESEMLDPAHCEAAPVDKVLDDANALNFVMDNIQGEIESKGF